VPTQRDQFIIPLAIHNEPRVAVNGWLPAKVLPY
jgi:hypothetical protein